MKKIDYFVLKCFRYIVQPLVLEVLMSSFERYPSWKITIPTVYLPQGGDWGPLLKQKFYIDWIFLFKSKILNFAMIGFHPISLSTFIRNFALYRNVKNSKNSNSFRSFQSRNFKCNRVISSHISVISKLERSFYSTDYTNILIN